MQYPPQSTIGSPSTTYMVCSPRPPPVGRRVAATTLWGSLGHCYALCAAVGLCALGTCPQGYTDADTSRGTLGNTRVHTGESMGHQRIYGCPEVHAGPFKFTRGHVSTHIQGRGIVVKRTPVCNSPAPPILYCTDPRNEHLSDVLLALGVFLNKGRLHCKMFSSRKGPELIMDLLKSKLPHISGPCADITAILVMWLPRLRCAFILRFGFMLPQTMLLLPKFIPSTIAHTVGPLGVTFVPAFCFSLTLWYFPVWPRSFTNFLASTAMP